MNWSGTAPKIAIVGAGPAGLTCARILTQAGIPVRIFEREHSPHSRSQGGTLDLHEETGIAAIKRAGLFQEFEAHCRYEGEDTIVADKHGKRYVDVRDTDTGLPEIDRVQLRQILIDSLPEGTLRWDSQVQSAERGKLVFQHGAEEEFDLIVGADGAWSKVRPLITGIKPFYAGIICVELHIRDIDARFPELAVEIGRGSHFAIGEEDGRAFVGQRLGDGSVRMYLFMRKPETWGKGFVSKSDKEIRQILLEELSAWSPKYHEWVNCCDDDIVTRPLYMLPTGIKWPTVPGVTLLGDSAHLMTPFAGEGVNVAMDDGRRLAEAIIASPDDLPNAVQEYEKWMFSAAAEEAHKTWLALMNINDVGGAQTLASRWQ